MKVTNGVTRWFLAIAYLLMFSSASAASDHAAASKTNPMSVVFRGVEYEHRWSKSGQNEFTPQGQSDLNAWQDMITFNVHAAVTSGEKLAEIANGVLGNYQRAGKILRTDSKPKTKDRPAEHLISAVLGSPTFLEAVFARFVLVDGVGTVVVYSHRVYGKSVGPAMSKWLQANGQQIENALMAWDKIPTAAALKTLPQSK